MVSTQKQGSVNTFVERLKKNSNFVLVKFDKTSHQSLETLRKSLKKEQSSFEVVKNTLFEKAVNKLALQNKLLKELKKKFFPLKATSALLSLGSDWSKGLSAFYQFAQKEKTLSFKFGILDNEGYDESNLTQIAQLPGKDVIMAKIIGSIKSPMTKLVYSLKYNTQKLVYILNQKSKGGES
jgi:large subunit ribosomal protein L10